MKIIPTDDVVKAQRELDRIIAEHQPVADPGKKQLNLQFGRPEAEQKELEETLDNKN